MRGSATATTRVWSDAAVVDGTPPAASRRAIPEPAFRLGAVDASGPVASCEPVSGGRPGVAPRTILDVVDEASASLARALEDANGTLARLSAMPPAVETEAFTVRVVLERRTRAAVLSSIDAHRAVLTTRDADGAVASWLVDDDVIVARLPPGDATRLGGDVVVTANEGERALLVVCGRRARHGGALLALSLDLATLDACGRRPSRWFRLGRASGSARMRRHDLGIRRPAPDARHTRIHVRPATSPSPERTRPVAGPPGMSYTDAARLDVERRTFARRRAGEHGGVPGGLPAGALVDVESFMAAASARFLDGRRGATAVLDASPVLYGVLVRYHGVSYVTRTATAAPDR